VAIYARKSSTTYANPPEGLHPAVCIDVIDLGDQPTAWGPKPKIELRWQLDEVNPETQKPFIVRARFTNSLHEKAILRQTLETWRNKKFTADELRGWDLEKLIGVCCQVQVVHAPGDEGRVWANVQAVVPFPKGLTKMRPRDYVREIDRLPQDQAVTTTKHEDDDDDPIPF
jgi:hypothetical protein